jgi:hypothetical protein
MCQAYLPASSHSTIVVPKAETSPTTPTILCPIPGQFCQNPLCSQTFSECFFLSFFFFSTALQCLWDLQPQPHWPSCYSANRSSTLLPLGCFICSCLRCSSSTYPHSSLSFPNSPSQMSSFQKDALIMQDKVTPHPALPSLLLYFSL